MTAPIPVEVGIAPDLKLRGHEWPVDGPPVVFVAGFGEDLDAWGPVTARVARDGFRVISIELRGHGLSDGDADPATTTGDVRALVAELAQAWGPVGYVGAGATAAAGLYLDPDESSPVHVLISPDVAEEDVDWSATTAAMRMLMLGAGDEKQAAAAKLLYRPMRGQKLWVSVGVPDQGTALLQAQPKLVEEIVMFMRRYLTGYHLAWVKEKAAELGVEAGS